MSKKTLAHNPRKNREAVMVYVSPDTHSQLKGFCQENNIAMGEVSRLLVEALLAGELVLVPTKITKARLVEAA